MREIKFRAWDNYTKKMIYNIVGIRFYPGGIVVDYQTEAGFEETECGTVELLLFTDCKDHTDKEIWEGDILRFFREDEEFHIGPVAWREQFSVWSVGLALTEIENALIPFANSLAKRQRIWWNRVLESRGLTREGTNYTIENGRTIVDQLEKKS